MKNEVLESLAAATAAVSEAPPAAVAAQAAVQIPVEPTERVFYSQKICLTISVNKGRTVLTEGGTAQRVDEKIIQFFQEGSDSKFGMFRTSDPELIAYLEKRQREVGDVFGPAEYYDKSTPDNIKVDALKRQLEESNRLIENLRRGNKLPSR